MMESIPESRTLGFRDLGQSVNLNNYSIYGQCSLLDNISLYLLKIPLKNLSSKTEYRVILIVRYYGFYGKRHLFELKINENFTTKERPNQSNEPQFEQFIFIIILLIIILFICCACAFCVFLGLTFLRNEFIKF